jgi:aspartyl-tRNA(Asn)/glutamyl-tRNA(Gln) amidotransferase subunit A
MKPTYWRVSRYGVNAMSSSLDQVWVITKNIEDAEILLRSISGYDAKDMTSVDRNDLWDRKIALWKSIRWVKIGIPKQYFGEGLDLMIADRMYAVIAYLKEQWAEIIDLDIPLLSYGVMTYYIICPAEVSSNMSRLEWMRFGYQKKTHDFDSLYDYFSQVRTEWLGKEVKRRILIGGYVLWSWHIDQYFNKARAVQIMLRDTLDSMYEQVDIILWPTTPTVAPYLGQFTNDPLKLYLMDVYTVIANLWWYPAVSIPTWMVNNDGVIMPVGCQLMSRRWNESILFQVGKVLEWFSL